MLEFAHQNEIILISMPSHTSHYLQPLDRSVFKSLKTHFYEQCRLWMKQNSGRRITRLSFGALLNRAWGKAASAENAISGFRATGVYPLNPEAIPDYAYIQDPIHNLPSTPISRKDSHSNNSAVEDNDDVFIPSTSNEPNRDPSYSPEMVPRKPKTSLNAATVSKVSKPSTPKEGTSGNIANYTPSRILQEISPIPQKLIEVRKRAKQVGTLLTSEEHINARKCVAEKTLKKEIKKEKEPKKCTVNKKKVIQKLSDNSDDVPLKILAEKTKKRKTNEEDNCRGCGENYYETQLIEDWLQCKVCQFWVHEHCTEFDDSCSKCGKKEKKTKNYQNN
ncbi:unnamed protein product [Arctia plantaginis]|uniref:Phorbol-ester/DAG-type domain-containing protein n=1 Tax=Arctia plantaginis TaxID=874455 RepID=A0A8S1BB26_ARCPL|nr:unnamed protein product [Arctia plantaginis]